MKERNYGLDALRIMSMMMIVIGHVMAHGGILSRCSKELSVHEGIVWLLESVVVCGVDIFAIISGYVGYGYCNGKKSRASKIWYLCFQVSFYTLTATIAYMFFSPERINPQVLVSAAFPVVFNTYWYFTAYFCIFFFMPYTNKMIDRISRRELLSILAIMMFLFSIIPTVFYSPRFAWIDEGYSVIWVYVLYIVGGYIRKYGISWLEKRKKCLLFCLICIVITWLSKQLILISTTKLLGTPLGSGWLVKYTSPTVICASIALVCYFSSIPMANNTVLRQLISFFSPLTFGVYLFHSEPLIEDTILVDRFYGYLEKPPFEMMLLIILTGLIVWLLGAFADMIRLMIFRLFRVDELCKRLDMLLTKYFTKMIEKLSHSVDDNGNNR